jgi:crotonobetainyl-CoA:carnitine CoA-transferase CaiB-like acyl-CoA transferase
MDAPLDGLRVVERAGVLAGPSAGQFLAEPGADGVGVENPRIRPRWAQRHQNPGGAEAS